MYVCAVVLIASYVRMYYVDLDDHVAKGVDPSLLVEPDRPRKGMRKGYSSFTRVVVTTRPDGVSALQFIMRKYEKRVNNVWCNVLYILTCSHVILSDSHVTYSCICVILM